MSWNEVADTLCPIARSLSVVGNCWTLLIMRELVMGVVRFEEFQAQTGMSSHLLSNRLKDMEEDGIIERELYNTRPARYEYHPTAKGKELDAILSAHARRTVPAPHEYPENPTKTLSRGDTPLHRLPTPHLIPDVSG